MFWLLISVAEIVAKTATGKAVLDLRPEDGSTMYFA
jgi:hypothetical protein